MSVIVLWPDLSIPSFGRYKPELSLNLLHMACIMSPVGSMARYLWSPVVTGVAEVLVGNEALCCAVAVRDTPKHCPKHNQIHSLQLSSYISCQAM